MKKKKRITKAGKVDGRGRKGNKQKTIDAEVKEIFAKLDGRFTPQGFIDKTKTADKWTEPQVYVAIQNMFKAGELRCSKQGRTKFYSLTDSKLVFDDEPKVENVSKKNTEKPMTKELEAEFNYKPVKKSIKKPGVHFAKIVLKPEYDTTPFPMKDVNIRIKVKAENQLAANLVTKHGEIYHVSVQQGLNVLVTSENATMEYGRDKMLVPWTGWLYNPKETNPKANVPLVTFVKI